MSHVMSNETRRLGGLVALSKFICEPCRICRRDLLLDDLRDGAVLTGFSRDGAARVAHRVCWDNFVELLQTMPAKRLYELANEQRGGETSAP